MKPLIVLGCSGGVDSSVAALLLMPEYSVYCVYLDIGLSPDGARQAEALANHLSLPFEIVQISDALEHHVCAPFARGYLSGRTPNPCAICNPTVKFPALFSVADRIEAEYVATGHYARNIPTLQSTPAPYLMCGKPANDQSYLLARLTSDQLARIRFPLGIYDKAEVRTIAADANLPTAREAASMEICFVPDNDYPAWLAQRGYVPPEGNFVDSSGEILGRHKGIHHYTLGQRRGLGIPAESRLFVTGIDPIRNEILLSSSPLQTQTVFCREPNWIALPPPSAPLEASVRLRHTKHSVRGLLTPLPNNQLQVDLVSPCPAPASGQLAVFYDGDIVLGSAWIESFC